MSDFEFPARVSTEEVIRTLTYLSHEDLLEFITDLDLAVADWDFTELVADYFEDQMHELKKIRTPEHPHIYVGDSDDCQSYPGCPVTWQEYQSMSRRGEV